MVNTAGQAKYYIVFLQADHYKTLPVEDEFEAHHQIHYLDSKPTTKVLGVFDPQARQFYWSIIDQDRQEHANQVSELTKELQ